MTIGVVLPLLRSHSAGEGGSGLAGKPARCHAAACDATWDDIWHGASMTTSSEREFVF
jgi:hypothetical protein